MWLRKSFFNINFKEPNPSIRMFSRVSTCPYKTLDVSRALEDQEWLFSLRLVVTETPIYTKGRKCYPGPVCSTYIWKFLWVFRKFSHKTTWVTEPNDSFTENKIWTEGFQYRKWTTKSDGCIVLSVCKSWVARRMSD